MATPVRAVAGGGAEGGGTIGPLMKVMRAREGMVPFGGEGMVLLGDVNADREEGMVHLAVTGRVWCSLPMVLRALAEGMVLNKGGDSNDGDMVVLTDCDEENVLFDERDSADGEELYNMVMKTKFYRSTMMVTGLIECFLTMMIMVKQRRGSVSDGEEMLTMMRRLIW